MAEVVVEVVAPEPARVPAPGAAQVRHRVLVLVAGVADAPADAEGEAKGTLDPLRAARVVVLAQAAALTGAAAAGWYLSQIVVVATDLSLVANRGRLLPLSALVVAALALAGAGVVAQRWCRIDPPDAGEGDSTPAAPSAP